MQDTQIAAKLRIMPEKAARWRNRFLDGGVAALDQTRLDLDADDHTRRCAGGGAEKTTQEKPANGI